MTKAVGDDESMLKSLQEVVHLFEMAQTSVFKLMSSVSSPCHNLYQRQKLTRNRTPFPSFCVIRSVPASFRNMTLT